MYSFCVMVLQIITDSQPKSPHGAHAPCSAMDCAVGPCSTQIGPSKEVQCLAKMALHYCQLRCKDSPDLGTVVLPELNCLRMRVLEEDNM